MSALTLLIFGFGLIFLCSRFIVGEVDGLAKRIRFSKFGVSFLLLGALTSLSEIFIAISSQASGVPEIYAGNLIGGMFVISLFIIPLLALCKNGLVFDKTFPRKKFLSFGLLSFLPIIVAIDGVIFRAEAILLLVAYLAFLYYEFFLHAEVVRLNRIATKRNLLGFFIIASSAVGIFFGSQFLVASTQEIALSFGIPMFILSLFLLSFGTNIPEISIAVTSLMKKNTDIAFGDYFGSASFNVLILGLFGTMNRYVAIDLGNGKLLLLFFIANLLFLFFGLTKSRIGRFEAFLLLLVFLLVLTYEIFVLS